MPKNTRHNAALMPKDVPRSLPEIAIVSGWKEGGGVVLGFVGLFCWGWRALLKLARGGERRAE